MATNEEIIAGMVEDEKTNAANAANGIKSIQKDIDKLTEQITAMQDGSMDTAAATIQTEMEAIYTDSTSGVETWDYIFEPTSADFAVNDDNNHPDGIENIDQWILFERYYDGTTIVYTQLVVGPNIINSTSIPTGVTATNDSTTSWTANKTDAAESARDTWQVSYDKIFAPLTVTETYGMTDTITSLENTKTMLDNNIANNEAVISALEET